MNIYVERPSPSLFTREIGGESLTTFLRDTKSASLSPEDSLLTSRERLPTPPNHAQIPEQPRISAQSSSQTITEAETGVVTQPEPTVERAATTQLQHPPYVSLSSLQEHINGLQTERARANTVTDPFPIDPSLIEEDASPLAADDQDAEGEPDTNPVLVSYPDQFPQAPRGPSLTLHTALNGYSGSQPSTTLSDDGTGTYGQDWSSAPITPSGSQGDEHFNSGEDSPLSADGDEYQPNSDEADLEWQPEARAGKTSIAADKRTESTGGVPAPKKSHARKQPEGHIKRARNAFILFRKHITDSGLIPTTVEVKHQNISVVAAKMWKEAPQDVRAKFQEMARIEKEEHARKYPNYRYQPIFRRTDIVRRRVRKDATEDDKVEAVAEALMKGKAGEDLEKEITTQPELRASTPPPGETSAARSRNRRRRDPGQLSKGAMRSQRAQQRAKQMRSHLLGQNLLNISLFNAAQQQAQEQQRAAATAAAQAHAHAQANYAAPYGSYAHTLPYATDYQSLGYDAYNSQGYEGYQQGYEPYASQGRYGDDMYRTGLVDGYQHQQPVVDYYHSQGQPETDATFYPGYAAQGGYESHSHEKYTLAPILAGQQANQHVTSYHSQRSEYGVDPRLHITTHPGLIATVEDDIHPQVAPSNVHNNDGDLSLQTPSGHVRFDEGLFDGALGIKGKDDGLEDFEQAVQQANEMSW